ncbi:MAG: acylneuraminate cytidylyltransferase [Myxococcota bacterium]|nr:acylneuraminate cytidylyltransferase [Myxococcota bacterium]
MAYAGDVGEEVLAVIPARGGSKGIPRKNLVEVGGLPLIAHTIRHAQRANSITRVVVSTDDSEIITEAESFGADVVKRPSGLSGEFASTESALKHTLEFLKLTEGYEPSLVVLLQCTSPLRRGGDIDAAYVQFKETDADSLFSGSRVQGFIWRMKADGVEPTYDYANRPRRQDTHLEMVENGSIYIFKPYLILEHENRLGGKITCFETDPLDGFQIDEPEDVGLFNALFQIGRGLGQSFTPVDPKMLVLDFDGVMTNDRVFVSEEGVESVICYRGDGPGIRKVEEHGVKVIVLSQERNPVVRRRCEKLSVECHHGYHDKLTKLKSIAEERGVDPENIVYVGNDLNDVECMQWVSWPVAVQDARPEVIEHARFITQSRGGQGAVREICDLITANLER